MLMQGKAAQSLFIERQFNDVYAYWHTFKIEDILFNLKKQAGLNLYLSQSSMKGSLLKKVTLHVFTHENVLI